MAGLQTHDEFNYRQHYDSILALMSTDTPTSFGLVRTRMGRCDDEAYAQALPKLSTPLDGCFELRLTRDDGTRVFYFGSFSRSGPVAVAAVNDRYEHVEITPPEFNVVLNEAARIWKEHGGSMIIVDDHGTRSFKK